jgi:RNA polymerase sigma-70 factor (ECF subfamily)
VDAWERGDVDAVVSMLTEDAAFAMPPLRTWFQGREAIAVFLAGWPLSGAWRWRHVRTRANGQEALAFYSWDPDAEAYSRFALNVLTLRDARISEVTAFLTRSTQDPDRRVLARLPEQPADPRRMAAAFERFGLPARLD